MAVLASSCGGTDDQLGSEPSGPSLAAEAASEEPAQEPGGDGSTDGAAADNKQPSADAGDGASANADGLVPIAQEDSGHEIVALIDGLHGPTDDISADLNQMMPFPRIPTPAGSHIMDVGASHGSLLTKEEGITTFAITATIKVDGEGADLVELFEADLSSAGWTQKSSQDNTYPPLDSPGTILSFVISDGGLGREDLTVEVISDEALGFTRIDLRYSASEFPDPDESIARRFAGWHGDIPLHDGAEIDRVQVGSTFGPGRTTVDMSSSYRVENLPSEDEDALQKVLLDKAVAAGIDAEARDGGSGLHIVRDDWDRFYTSSDNPQTVLASTKVITPPFDGVAAVVGEEKSDEPLPEVDASADEIQDVVSDILGPTADVSPQMQRLGLFPDIPTPNGADIVGLSAGVNHVIGDDGVKAANTTVEMFINGELDDVSTFYEAQLAGLGWTEGSNNTEKTDDGLSTVKRVVYQIPQEPGQRISFTLTITDDVDNTRTRVRLAYSEFVPVSGSGIERWQSWYGNGPFPDGGELLNAGVSTFGFGSAVFYQAEIRYPGTKLADIEAEIEAAIGASDYALADGEEVAVESNAELTNPNFVNVDIWLWDNYSDGGRIDLNATRPFS